MATDWFELLLHLALLLLLPPLMFGIIQKTKAMFAGRRGAPLLQPYFDLVKLLRKGTVYSRTTTWVFRAGPMVALGSALTAGLVVPLHAARAPLSFEGDIIAFAYLLGLGRFFTMAAALDTGSSFEGMGASREAAFSALAEPALLLALANLCIPAGGVSFVLAWQALPLGEPLAVRPELIAVALALFAVLLAENSRIPVDDPNTHLELTMVHEVMVLDHGGPDLAYVLYASGVKLLVFASLLVHLLPIRLQGGWRDAALFTAGVIGTSVLVGVVESVMARLRLVRVPQFLVGASVVAAVGLLVMLARGGQ
jgi:formate hydrogenlyase subunit 4